MFWIDGRLPWPLVATIGFLTLSTLILDFAWRIVIIQFETLLIFAAFGNLVGLGALLLICLRLRRGVKALRPRTGP
jgi:hypothetical protein